MSERENLSGSRGEYGECLKAKQKFNMELYNRCLKDLCKTIERQRTEWDDFQKESAKRKDSPKRNGMPNDNLAEALPQRNLQESLLFEILEIVKNLEKSFHCLCQHLSKKETFREEVKQTNGKMSSEEFWKNREEVPPILIRKIEAEESKKLHKSPEVSSPKKELSPKGTVQEEQTNVLGDNALTGQKTDSGKIQEINVPLKTAIRDDESIELQEDVIYVPEERSYKAESGKQLSIRSSKKQYDLKPVTKTESFIERLISGRSSKKISREGSVAEMKIEKMHFERKKTPNLEQSLFHMEAPSGNQEKQNQEQSKRESRQPSEFQEPSKPESRQPSEIREISKPESKQPSEIREISKPESRQPSGIQEQSKPGSKQPSGIQEQSKPGSKQTSRTSGAGTPKIQENDVQETDKQLSTSQAKSDSDKEEPSLENPHSP